MEKISEGLFLISFVTELELLSYPHLTTTEEKVIRNFLNDITIVDINPEIKLHTISLRTKYKLKLPDAIIAATAMYKDAALITFDIQLKKVKEINMLIMK